MDCWCWCCHVGVGTLDHQLWAVVRRRIFLEQRGFSEELCWLLVVQNLDGRFVLHYQHHYFQSTQSVANWYVWDKNRPNIWRN